MACLVGFSAGLNQPLIGVQGDGVTRELCDVLSQVEATEQLLRGGFVRVHVLVGARVCRVKVQGEVQQLLEPPLVEHAHQIWKRVIYYRVLKVHLELRSGKTRFVTWTLSVFLCGGDFMKLPRFVNITALNNLKVQEAGDLGEQEYFHQLAWSKHSAGG